MKFSKWMLFSLFFTVNAAQAVTIKSTLSKVHVNGTGGFYIVTEGKMTNNGCGTASWYKIPNDSPYAKEMFSVALTGYVSGKPIQLYLEGCDGEYPKIKWLNVSD